MLSPEEITQYHEDGYVIPDFRVPAEALEAIKAMHASLLAQRPEFRDYSPALPCSTTTAAFCASRRTANTGRSGHWPPAPLGWRWTTQRPKTAACG